MKRWLFGRTQTRFDMFSAVAATIIYYEMGIPEMLIAATCLALISVYGETK